MKIKLTMQDADGVENAIDNELTRTQPLELDGAELDAVLEIRRKKIRDSLRPWLQDAEYVRIEIDTEARTATVLKNN